MPDGDLGTSVFVKDNVVCKSTTAQRILKKKQWTMLNGADLHRELLTTIAEPGGNSKNRRFRCKILSNRSAFVLTIV